MPRKKRPLFEATDVQCLYRRNGRKGPVYSGRLKRGKAGYWKKLGPDFELSRKQPRQWLGKAEERASNAKQNGEKLTTWGDFKDAWLSETDLDVALAPKSKSYRRECVGRIIKIWNIGGVLGEPGQLDPADLRDLPDPDREEKRWYPTLDQFQSIVAKM